MTTHPYFTVNGHYWITQCALQCGNWWYEATIGGWLVPCHVIKPIW